MKPLFRVGDWVTFKRGSDPVEGIVVEDRGEVWHQRRRFYRVEVTLPPVEPTIYTVPEDGLTACISNGRKSPQLPNARSRKTMSNVTISLTDKRLRRLEKLAAEAHVPPEELLHTWVEEWLATAANEKKRD